MKITYVEQMFAFCETVVLSIFMAFKSTMQHQKDLENLKSLFFVCICQNMFIYSYRLKENVLYFEACPADLFGSNYSVLCLLLFHYYLYLSLTLSEK